MKIIDLLNKIANGEEVPKKVRFAGIIFEYDEDDQMYNNYEHKNICDYAFLNDEVEILEEEKKIPKKIKIEEKSITVKGTTFFREKDIEIFQKLSMEINEIIDYLKSKGE